MAFETLKASLQEQDQEGPDDRMHLVHEFGTYAKGPPSGAYLSRRLELLLFRQPLLAILLLGFSPQVPGPVQEHRRTSEP